MMAEYERLFRDAFVDAGDAGVSKNRALSELSRIYGPNGVTGNSRLMKFPPQQFYPQSEENPTWMRDQIEAEVSKFVFGDDAKDSIGWSPVGKMIFGDNWISSKSIQMVSDASTRNEIATGKPPSYTIAYIDRDGEFVPMPGRFYFDASELSPAKDKEARLNSERKQLMEMREYQENHYGKTWDQRQAEQQ